MLRKWLEIIFDHRISLRERMFRIVTGICMVALIFILPMGKSVLNILILAASLVAMSGIVKISIRRQCIQRGATAIMILLLLVFPISFFTAGGFYSGMPEWFVFCLRSVQWRQCFAMGSIFISRNWSYGIYRRALLLILPFLWSW